MTAPYPIESDATGATADAGGVWLYCPACSAVYPAGPLDAVPCPNTDQHDHPTADDINDREDGPAMARTTRSARAAARVTAREQARRDPDTAEAGPPSVAEIAALTSRLRHLHSPDATEAERAAFLADKNALLARIAAADPTAHPTARKD